MSVVAHLRALNEIDLADLDMEDLTNWPLALKLILLSLLFITALISGFYLHIEDVERQRVVVEQKEVA